MPVPTASVNSPFSRCGMPQANSTTSRPRCTSPSASDSTLPCSAVMMAESSLRSRSSNSFSLNMTRARRSGGVAAHAGHAAAAAATALLDFRGVGQRDRGDDLAGRGIEHVAELAAGAGDRLAADEMADFPHVRLPWDCQSPERMAHWPSLLHRHVRALPDHRYQHWRRDDRGRERHRHGSMMIPG